jgi:hypothetical protein
MADTVLHDDPERKEKVKDDLTKLKKHLNCIRLGAHCSGRLCLRPRVTPKAPRPTPESALLSTTAPAEIQSSAPLVPNIDFSMPIAPPLIAPAAAPNTIEPVNTRAVDDSTHISSSLNPIVHPFSSTPPERSLPTTSAPHPDLGNTSAGSRTRQEIQYHSEFAGRRILIPRRPAALSAELRPILVPRSRNNPRSVQRLRTTVGDVSVPRAEFVSDDC